LYSRECSGLEVPAQGVKLTKGGGGTLVYSVSWGMEVHVSTQCLVSPKLLGGYAWGAIGDAWTPSDDRNARNAVTMERIERAIVVGDTD